MDKWFQMLLIAQEASTSKFRHVMFGVQTDRAGMEFITEVINAWPRIEGTINALRSERKARYDANCACYTTVLQTKCLHCLALEKQTDIWLERLSIGQ